MLAKPITNSRAHTPNPIIVFLLFIWKQKYIDR
jgi:hypothetical protein